MASSGGGVRSFLASIIGFIIVAIVLIVLFNVIIGALFWALRGVLVIAVLIGLFVLYLNLKSPRS